MKSVIIGTAGHIDHGKSALVRALTNIDPDRLKEEQERGITIDLGFAHWQAADINFAFVDVPGHERFVKNMLAGVGGFDAVMLVVAADESVMPQTREHFQICRLLRIPSGFVVLTKADLVDADTVELVRMEVRDLVAGSFLQDAPIIAASSRTGEGLDRVKDALVFLGGRAADRPAVGPGRLPIDRVFSMKGFGTVVTGTLVSGQIHADEDLDALPDGRRVKVRGIQVHGAAQTTASAGQRVALNVGGVETSELGRGQTLVAPGSLEPTRMIDALVEIVPGAKPLRHGARVRFHQGTSEVLGRAAIAGLAGADDPNRPGPVVELAPGDRAYIRLRLESPAVVTRGDRYILRAYSPPVTIAGGEVLDPKPPRGGIRTAGAKRRFAALDFGTGQRADVDRRVVAFMVEEAGASGLPRGAVGSRAGLRPDAARRVLEGLASDGTIVLAGEQTFDAALVRSAAGEVLKALAEYHRAQPLSEGMAREEVRERFFGHAGPGLFERVLADLTAERKIVARDRLALAGHTLALSADEEQAHRAIEQAFREGGLRPPEQAILVTLAHNDVALVDRMVKLLLRQKVLVKVENLIFHEEALRRLREDVAAMKGKPAGTSLDVGTFKDRYGITRKYAIPLLEYLDRERITRRVGEARVVL